MGLDEADQLSDADPCGYGSGRNAEDIGRGGGLDRVSLAPPRDPSRRPHPGLRHDEDLNAIAACMSADAVRSGLSRAGAAALQATSSLLMVV